MAEQPKSSDRPKAGAERTAFDQREQAMAEGDGEEVTTGGEVEILAAKVRVIHDRIIRTTGGVLGEKPAGLLSACARPFQSAGGTPAYPTFMEKAAVMFHGIICGHVFADGSKRTGTMIAAAIVELDGHLVTPDEVKKMEAVALQAALPRGMSVQEIIARFREIFPPNAVS